MIISLTLLVCLAADGTSAFSPSWPSMTRDATVARMSVPNLLDTATSGLLSICRLPYGVDYDNTTALPEAERPVVKQLFDVENSLACRMVREKITELDLVVEKVVPSAPNSRVFTEEGYAYSLPEGSEIPRMVISEQGTDITLEGKAQILEFLDNKFGVSSTPDEQMTNTEKAVKVLEEVGKSLSNVFRIGRGNQVSPAATKKSPEKPLILYSYEGNQFCRLVREVLTELDIVYELRSAGKGSPRREELADISGMTQCPFLRDPNTGIDMFESSEIIRYLYKTYAQWTPPNEVLQWASNVILPAAKPLFRLLAPLQAGSRKDDEVYASEIARARTEIEEEVASAPVVVYTYSLSPFSSETKALLDNLEIEYEEISLGAEWIPGLIADGGAQKRAALLEMTGQSSLPHVFIGGTSIGGIFSGTPGLIPALEQGTLLEMIKEAGAIPSLPSAKIETSEEATILEDIITPPEIIIPPEITIPPEIIIPAETEATTAAE